MDAHRALVLAEHDTELDRAPLVIPLTLVWEGEPIGSRC